MGTPEDPIFYYCLRLAGGKGAYSDWRRVRRQVSAHSRCDILVKLSRASMHCFIASGVTSWFLPALGADAESFAYGRFDLPSEVSPWANSCSGRIAFQFDDRA
jgi:hypothetical protein